MVMLPKKKGTTERGGKPLRLGDLVTITGTVTKMSHGDAPFIEVTLNDLPEAATVDKVWVEPHQVEKI